MRDDDRQLAELHLRERREFHEALHLRIQKMERNVERGTALQRILKAERLAANRDSNEQEYEHVADSKR